MSQGKGKKRATKAKGESTSATKKRKRVVQNDLVSKEEDNEFVNLLNAKRPKLPKQEPTAAHAEEYKKAHSPSNILQPSDVELMQEFEEETETIFKQSETCYTHYKAMLRAEK